MKKLVGAALVIATALLADEARADEWYGYQIIASDLGTVLVSYGVSKVTKRGEYPLIVGLVGYLVPPVTIHAIHGEPYRALGSGGLRLGTPLAFGLVGGTLTSSEKDFGLSALWGFVMGAAVGAIVASTIDSAALAYESKEEPPPSQTQQPLRTISFGGSF